MSEQAAEELARQARSAMEAARAEHDAFVAGLGGDGVALEGARAAGRGDAAAALAVLTDTRQPEDRRIEVLNRLAAELIRQPQGIDALLRLVRDRDERPAVRFAALRALGAAAVQVDRFQPHDQGYRDALRDLITDPQPDLREWAVTTLAQEHDPVAQQALLDGLEGDAALPVSRERAIELLAEDDHLDNLPRLRELYRTGSDADRQTAVRFMGSYPDAGDDLETILRDKTEADRVRQSGAASLRYLAPDRYEAVAKEIAVDPTDAPGLRVAALKALRHLGDTAAVRSDGDFMDRVRATQAEGAPEVAEAARELAGPKAPPP